MACLIRHFDAAIGKRDVVAANFEELRVLVEEAHRTLVQEATREVGSVGEQQQRILTLNPKISQNGDN